MTYEAKLLQKYQHINPHIRPMIDELTSPKEPPAIVLEYLDSDLRAESRCKLLSRPEIKQVAKNVLKVRKTLHQDKIVHSGKSYVGQSC